MASSPPFPRDRGPNLLGHPRGLFVLFFAEMWERFSYYGMRALLVFYLTKVLLFDDARAGLTYGAYTSMIFLTPVLGGWLADRLLGGRKAVLFGGVLIAFGHLVLALEGAAGWFFLGLAFVIVGTGFLKANISAIVGTLYARDDVRRDPAYTIFYMGVNMGSFLGSLACGWVGERVGWAWGFGMAAVGMLLGLAVFVGFQRDLLGRSEPPDPARLAARVAGLPREWWIYLGSIAGVVASWWLVQHEAAVGLLLGGGGALLVLYIVATAVRTLPPVERDRIFAAMALIVGSILFWALYEQVGSSLNLFTDRHVDRVILGWTMPASMMQAMNPFFIITLAPVFAALWTWLARRGWEPSAPAKFALAVLQVGLGFLVLVWGARAQAGALTPLVFIVLINLLHTTGELCLSPVGLSAMTKMAVPRLAGLMMGTWFFALAAGEFVAGQIASVTGGDGGAGATLLVYDRIGWIAIGVGVAMFVVVPLVKRLMHLDTLGDDDAALAGQPAIGDPDATGVRVGRERRP